MIVMKFGGTSVQDAAAIERAAQIVSGRLGDDPVVVVSAMAKVTDQLLAMASAAGEGDRERALELARGVRERHYVAASELLGTGIFTQFHSELEADFDGLDELLRGIAAVGELTPRTLDNVVSHGERLSSKLVAAAFSARKIPAELVDARACIVTDNTFTKAVPQMDLTNDAVRERIDAIAASSGYSGRIVLLAEESFSWGDARIEWADGGAERRLADQLNHIDAALARIAAPLSPPTPPSPEENDR